MVSTETLAAESTIPDDPLSRLVAIDGIPTGICGRQILIRGGRSGEGRRRDDDLGLTLLLSGPGIDEKRLSAGLKGNSEGDSRYLHLGDG